MTEPAAFAGDYSGLRFVKSRSIAVVEIEIPIERASAFVAVFGTPTQATGVPVAIARLDPAKAVSAPPKPVESPEKERQRWTTLPPAKQAAIRCNDGLFEKFLTGRYPHLCKGINNPAETVRFFCGVNSRADILEGTAAASNWRKLDNEFLAWKNEPTYD